MAYETFALTNARLEVRCAPGDIVHVAFMVMTTHGRSKKIQNIGPLGTVARAIDRARFIGRDPDFC